MESMQQFGQIRPIPAKPHALKYGQVAVPARHQPSSFQAMGNCLPTEAQLLEICAIPCHIDHLTIVVKDLDLPLG
jgi:hypothetical protein